MKRGLSSIISAVLLISLVVILGVIFFSWISGITGKVIMLEGQNIALSCENVGFQTSYSGGILYVSNIGNIQIYGIKAMLFKEKSYETKDTNEFLDSWPVNGLNPGSAFSGPVSVDLDVKKMIIVPVLIGKINDGKEERYSCGEGYGEEIILEE